jgi:hypothetical protein
MVSVCTSRCILAHREFYGTNMWSEARNQVSLPSVSSSLRQSARYDVGIKAYAHIDVALHPHTLFTMLFTHLLTIVSIALSLGIERVNAVCCRCYYAGECLDGTECTPYCGRGYWYVWRPEVTPCILQTLFTVTSLGANARAAAGGCILKVRAPPGTSLSGPQGTWHPSLPLITHLKCRFAYFQRR